MNSDKNILLKIISLTKVKVKDKPPNIFWKEYKENVYYAQLFITKKQYLYLNIFIRNNSIILQLFKMTTDNTSIFEITTITDNILLLYLFGYIKYDNFLFNNKKIIFNRLKNKTKNNKIKWNKKSTYYLSDDICYMNNCINIKVKKMYTQFLIPNVTILTWLIKTPIELYDIIKKKTQY